MDFYEIRESKEHGKSKLKSQLHLLWRRELAEIQQKKNLHKYAGKSRAFVEEYVLNKIDTEELKRMIIEELFERDYTIFDE